MNSTYPGTTTLLATIAKHGLVDAGGGEKAAEDYSDYVDEMFPRWALVLLFVCGVVGNTLSFICFYKMNCQKTLNSTYIYLIILCMIDISAIFIGLGDVILIYSDIIVRGQSVIHCRILTFLLYTSTHFSSFLLAAVSIDRAIAVTFFSYAKKYCKPNVAYKVIGGCFCLAVVINFHTLCFLGYDNYKNDTAANIYNNRTYNKTLSRVSSKVKFVCASEPGALYDRFLYPYFDWIDLLSYTIVPFFVMGTCTIMIVKVLCDSKKRLKRMDDQSTIRKTSAKNEEYNELMTDTRKKKSNKKINKSMQLTYTLILINIVFFLLLSPLTILRIIDSTFPELNPSKSIVMAFYLLAYANHCFNFIFYGLSSEAYREMLFKILFLDRVFSKKAGDTS